jgi:hypothetical protein
VRFRFSFILLAAISTAACDEELGLQEWDATPDTVSLYSLSRTDLLGLPSAYDFSNQRVVEVEAPGAGGNWDFALAGTTQLELIPAPAFEGQASARAAIAPITGQTFESLMEAPSDTSKFTRQPVPITVGAVYAIRTRRVACGFSTSVHYGKIKVLTADPVKGSASFSVVVNPFCNDRSFEPTD